MRFSSRLPWSVPENRLWQALARRRAEGRRVLDLTQSNPTRAGFVYGDRICAALADPRALVYDPHPAGSPAAREAVAAWCTRRGPKVHPWEVVLASGTSDAYAWLFKLLCDPGDEILAPRPSYPLFEFLAGLESVRVVPYALVYDGRWWVDWDSLERAAGPRARAVVVVQPNNPTGSFLNRDEIRRLAAFCAARGLAIVSDEVFAEYPLGGEVPPSLSIQAVAPCFVLGGLSKAAGLPQMKLSWIVVGGPEEFRRAAIERLELIADTYLPVGTPVQCALPVLLEEGERVRDQILLRTRENYRWLVGRFGAESPVSVLAAAAGWYAVLRVPRVRSEEDWCLELLERGVLMQPGYFYDFAEEAYLVLSLLTPPGELAEGVEVLAMLAGC
ncbi:MAG: pyridoxal phosphate-dependent aminotransferase [Bryobacterales bacterium]|nr:pyridoxal phosphate-dependent aminotransferase [Bryobacteraceae bacterium]MDW8129109.1 pyridoxal phosphate-dependent aminotransferase [Bryobacterales bacterium]